MTQEADARSIRSMMTMNGNEHLEQERRLGPGTKTWTRNEDLPKPALEHFPAKCAAVRRRKCDKCKNLERVSDSSGTETALDHEPLQFNPILVEDLMKARIRPNPIPAFRDHA
jgi:hypothetical protein